LELKRNKRIKKIIKVEKSMNNLQTTIRLLNKLTAFDKNKKAVRKFKRLVFDNI
jgi:glutaredoxin-related protein